MRKTQPDEWTSRSVTSRFQVLTQGHQLACTNQPGTVFLTSTCGFGWRFGASGRTEQVTTYKEHGAAMGKDVIKTTLHLYFDPHLIANANFGNLVISVTSKDLQDALIIDSITRFTCKLPGARTTIGTYVFTGDFESPLEVAITAEFSESLDFALQPSPPPSLTRALRESINGSEIVDVKFLLFSSRSPSGVKGAMTPLFAKASVIKGHSDHLDTLLSADSFKESSLVNLDEPLPPAEQSSQELFYDYESDSDLDYDEDVGINDQDEEDSKAAPTVSLPSLNEPPEVPSLPLASAPRSQRVGRILTIRNSAYQTWKCFLQHLYGETITFRALKSSSGLGTSGPSGSEVENACSPKSMYRLADEYGTEPLLKLSRDAIAERLTEENIVEELFSSFTHRYKEIIDIEVNFFYEHRRATPITVAFSEKMDQVVSGDLPGRADVMRDIYFRLMVVERPPKPATPPPPPDSPVHFAPEPEPSPPPEVRGRGRGRGGRR
ncbi:hypothetical protein ONZ45_g19334 [Pleurotus djamor]|nr:hypothetical protein ONZ45_g19334 [Pleurotus djamor]